MTVDEARNAIEELKAQGLSEEAIAASLYEMYKTDKLDIDQFGALVKLVGYDLSDEFMAMSDEEKKNQEIGEFGMSEEEEEEENDNSDAAQDNESSDNDDASKEDEKEENPFEKYNSSKDEDDDEEKREAKKMYGF